MNDHKADMTVNHASQGAALNIDMLRKYLQYMRINTKQQLTPTTSTTSSPVNWPVPFFNNDTTLPNLPPGQHNPLMAALITLVARVVSLDDTQPNSKPGPVPVSDLPIIASVAAGTASVITPLTAVIIQVHHTVLNETLYFNLSVDVTLQAFVKGLQMSFNDNNISANLLHYKRLDGTWQCLINPSGGNYMRTMLNQAIDSKLALQMKVLRGV
ncbi:hypothetical protein K492DRAFT_207889 [Lichtheimia hyalospora FSU 10163]|nr:hypothetical protein K492DRAFT_207889 [Lichtheimia hyalospora FSU 10163]